MTENNTKKRKKGSISEEDISTVLRRYTATTVLALLQEVAQFPDVKLNWNALVKKTSTGISNAREYQMLWRHLAYRNTLLEKLEDGAEPLDDDSDLEYELEPCPSVSTEVSTEAAACVKVLIASGLPNDSSVAKSSMVEAPLTINIPNVQSFRVSSENSEPTCSMQGMNITVPVSVQKKFLPAVTSAETLEGNRSACANQPAKRKRKPWSEAEDMELVAAVQKCGVGNWANILRGDFRGDRTASQLAQRWTIIKKRFGNLNVEGNSTIPQLSEAQLATRSALSIALDMPGLKTKSGNSAPPTNGGEASVQAQSELQQGPIASVEVQNQSQQGPITSVSSHNQPQKGPITNVPAQNSSQQGPVASVQVPNHSQQQKPQVTLKKAPAKSFSTTGSILGATAVAAGACIDSPKVAASLLKAAQTNNAIPIMTSAEPLSSPVTSSTLHPGSVKPSTQRVEHTPFASSSSLNASIQQCNAVTSSPTVDGPRKEELRAVTEIKGSMSDSLPKEQVRENGACVSKNEPAEGVKEHKEALSNPESELKNLEAVSEHPNEKLMVEGDHVDVRANVVEESENANDNKTDCSLVKRTERQPTAEDSCRN